MDAISGDETLPADEAAREPDTLPVVERGHYDILSEHARGGLGRILRARDRRTGRLVAIKEMLDGATDAAARFQREAMITANLQHPAIVPVYELGRWPDGEPFYAMKLVAGKSLDKAIARASSRDERLAMLPRLIDVAEAMAYAHGEGVIHRDLKPANVLVGAYGETVVIDWGLAKRAGDTDAGDAASLVASSGDMTVAGAVMGTPVYMPPEQARGEQVDARADVYALGAMLYHLLSGKLPYGESRSAEEVLAKVRAGPPSPLAELEPGVPPDLLAIVAKAMAQDRDGRYATARDLAEDLRRFQTGQLVSAHAYSAWQLVRRWLRRYRAAVGVAAILVAALAVTAVVAVQRITSERNVAQRERASADRQRALVEARNNRLIITQARGGVAIDPTRSLAWLKQLPSGAQEWVEARMIAGDAVDHGAARWVLPAGERKVNDVVFTPDGRSVIGAGDDAKIRIWDLATGGARVLDEPGPVDRLEVARDGTRMISLGPWQVESPTGRRIVIWDLPAATPRVLPQLDGERDAHVLLSPDSRTLAVITCAGAVRLVDLDTLAPRLLRASTEHPRQLCANEMAFSADGRTLAAETVASAVDLLDVTTGALVRTLDTTEGRTVRQIEFTPDGGRLLILTAVDLASWGLARGDRQPIVPNKGEVLAFATNRDGTRLALAGDDRTVRVWTMVDGSYRVLTRHSADLAALVIAPDLHRVVSASEDGTIQVSDLDGIVSRTLRGHDRAISEIAVSDDGRWIASASGDGTVRVWSMDGGRRIWDSTAKMVTQVVPSSDGASLVLTAFDGAVERWTLDGARTEVRPGLEPDWHPNPLAETPDGRVLAVARVDGGIDVWSRGAAMRTVGAPALIAGVVLSRDGARLAWVSQEGAVDVEVAAGEPRRLSTPGLGKEKRRALAIGPDLLVWGEAAGALAVHDLSRDVTRTLPGTGGEIRVIALTPDATSAISASVTGNVIRWDLATGESTLLHTLPTSDNARSQLAISPDGTRLASAGADHALRITDLTTGRGQTFPGHADRVMALAFSPDGRSLASASDDMTVRLWDVATGDNRAIAHHEEVYALAFAPDGRLITATVNGTLSVILDDAPRDEAGLRGFLDAATNLVVDPEAR